MGRSAVGSATLFLALAASVVSAPMAMAQDATPAVAPSGEDSAELWKGLRVGMTADEVAAALPNISEIKRARASHPEGKEPRVSIRYVDGYEPGVVIGDLKFELAVVFQRAQLVAVLLAADNICAFDAQSRFDAIISALGVKYPDMAVSSDARPDVNSLLRQSRIDGEPASAMMALADAERTIAAGLTARAEKLAYISEYGQGKLAGGLARYSNMRNASRLAECNGSGDERVRIGLAYMSRAYSDEIANSAATDEAERDRRVAEGL